MLPAKCSTFLCSTVSPPVICSTGWYIEVEEVEEEEEEEVEVEEEVGRRTTLLPDTGELLWLESEPFELVLRVKSLS